MAVKRFSSSRHPSRGLGWGGGSQLDAPFALFPQGWEPPQVSKRLKRTGEDESAMEGREDTAHMYVGKKVLHLGLD